MPSKNVSRRDVVKALGAGATVAGTSTLSASAVSGGVDRPVVYVTKNVENNFDWVSLTGNVNNVLFDALPTSINGIDYGYPHPDFSDESTTSGVFQAFNNFLSTSADDPSAETNILITDDQKYTDRRYEFDGDATVINAANYFANTPDPNRYGSSETYQRYWSMLVGVGRNYEVGYQEGRIYKDSSVTSDYIRTPMTGFNTEVPDDTLTTNDCGTQTYENDTLETFDLRYTDCSKQTIDANHN